jgi:hypothetical protein
MNRRLGVAFIVPAVMVADVLTGAQQSAQRPTFRSAVDLVSVDVSVRQSNRAVTGLGAEAFRMVDNGMPQTVDTLAVEPMPIDVTVVVDCSADVMLYWLSDVKSDLKKMARLLSHADRMRLVMFGTDVREVFPMQSMTGDPPLAALALSGHSISLSDALVYALVRPPEPGRRQLVVAITNGNENSSMIEDELLVEVARRSEAVLDAILYSASQPPGVRLGTLWGKVAVHGRRAMLQASDATGGTAYGIHDFSDVASASSEIPSRGAASDRERRQTADAVLVDTFRRTLSDFRESYVLRYLPHGVTRGGWHDLKVTVTAPGADRYAIRARKGYFGGGSSPGTPR